MFDTALPIRLVQVQSNKSRVESYLRQYIYTFFIKDEYRRVKYVASVKEYTNNLLTIDFYAKINAVDKYKVLTHQFKFGRLGATILLIMSDVQQKTGEGCFGILSASLINEDDNLANKRYKVYIKILQRKLDPSKFLVAGVAQNSYIFITPINFLINVDNIYLQYGEIFKETN